MDTPVGKPESEFKRKITSECEVAMMLMMVVMSLKAQSNQMESLQGM